MSVESMMLNPNIAEIIPDQGNMDWKLVVGVFKTELWDGGVDIDFDLGDENPLEHV
jgi:hypothetical protein